MRILFRSILALTVLWVIAAAGIFWVDSLKPTPKKLMNYVAEHPLEGLAPAHRDRIIEKTARLLNALTFEQRQELKESGTIRSFFAQLNTDERRRFLDLTVPEGFRQLIGALNKMEPVDRNRLVQRTLRNVRRHSGETDAIGGEDELPRMIEEGMSMFEREASAEVRLAFAPVVEEVQKRRCTRTKGGAQRLP